jgi:hypothetical protein
VKSADHVAKWQVRRPITQPNEWLNKIDKLAAAVGVELSREESVRLNASCILPTINSSSAVLTIAPLSQAEDESRKSTLYPFKANYPPNTRDGNQEANMETIRLEVDCPTMSTLSESLIGFEMSGGCGKDIIVSSMA